MDDATKKALDVLVEIAEDTEIEPDPRIRAAATILGAAKTPEVKEGVSGVTQFGAGRGSDTEGAGARTSRPTTSVRDAAWSGAWAKPLRVRKFHFFRDGSNYCLCGAYMTMQAEPSRFGTGQPDDERCPTCERKLGYLIEARAS